MHPLNLTMEIFLVGAENDTNIDDSAGIYMHIQQEIMFL